MVTSLASEDRRSNAEGSAWMMMSVVTAALMTLGVRWASDELPSTLIVFQRAIGGAVLIMAACLLVPRLRAQLRFSAPWLHVWRGALVGFSTQLGFYTISELPLATATVLFFSAPIFVALLAVPIHGERIGIRRSAAIAAGFIGVIVVMRPGFIAFELAMVTALGSSLLFALALLSARRISNQDGPLAAYFSSVIMTIIISAPLALPVWQLPVSGFGWMALGLVVVMSMARSFGDLQAYRLAEASVLAPLAYTRIVLIAIAGYAFFNEIPDGYTILGGAIIVAAALYIAQRERLLKGGQKR